MTADSWLKEERLTDSLIPPIHQPPTFSRFLFSREQEKKNPTLPLFPFFRPPEFLRSLRKGYATRNYRRFRGKRKKKRLNSENMTREWFFENEKFVADIYEKNHERINFPQNPSFENFEAMIKIAWSGHSPGEEEGEEKKQRRRRRKRRRKWKKERRKDNRYLNGKYNFFNECFNCSWIFIFTSVLWTFNKAVFTRREVWRSGNGGEKGGG